MALDDEFYISRCFQLAANGLGHVSPNPLVGCVVVKEGRVVAEGFHQQYGSLHAERNALLRLLALPDGPVLAQDATLYVNLEPCSHHGHTPPCADLVVQAGISRVVCSNDDPNPLVNGRGFDILQHAGIDVARGVLHHKGRWLNRRFFTFIEQHRPYVILKWAQSADGYMAPASNKPYWLSQPWQSTLSHMWRTQEDAILIGSQTFIDDAPQLTARRFSGRNPRPVVLDRRGRLSNVPDHWLHLRSTSLRDVLDHLYHLNLQSVIVEGGRQVLDAFLAEGLYDEVRVVQCPSLLGSGLRAPSLPSDRHNVFVYQ